MNAKNLAAHFQRPHMGRRLLALAISLTAMGVCIAVFKTVGFGTDPCSTFTLGVSARTGITFGTCQLLFNLLMFIPVIRCDLSRIGIGTIGNMVGVGYIADLCMRLIGERLPPGSLSMAERILMFTVSMAVFLVAVSFYIVVDLGVAPYDAISQLIAARTGKLSYRSVRMIWDISMLLMGFLMGSTIGLTTLITGFFLGPAIALVTKCVHGWFE